jgi:hypothetical protein
MPALQHPSSTPVHSGLNAPHSGTRGPSAQASTSNITAQPSPAVISTTSHKSTHSLPRRFLGPMPENVTNSTEVEKHRRNLGAMRRAAIGKMQGAIRRREEEDSGFGEGSEGGQGRIRGVVRRVRVKRFRQGKEVVEDVEIPSDESEGEVEQTRHWYGVGKGKKKMRKDVWVGESFDIGREFVPAPQSSDPAANGAIPVIELPQNGSLLKDVILPRRPAVSKHSTQETFFTARTEASSLQGSTNLQDITGHDIGSEITGGSPLSLPLELNNRTSQSSSMHPLLPTSPDQHLDGDPLSRPGSSRDADHSPSSRFRRRLKSAMRKPPEEPSPGSASSQRLVFPKTPKIKSGKPKTVQFPVDLDDRGQVSDGEVDARPLKGNKRPVDPGEVLAREGDDVAGTSAGAVEEAMEDEDSGDDDVPLPGEVIMRGECGASLDEGLYKLML